MQDSAENYKKLADFGYDIPSQTTDKKENAIKVQKLLEQIYAQVEQTKDVVWCCLDQQSANDEQKLSPQDAYHAITSEINSILIHTSQVYKFYLGELTQEQQTRQALEEQLVARENDYKLTVDSESNRQRYQKMKDEFEKDRKELHKQIQNLQNQLAQAEELNAQLEKQNMVLKGSLPENSKIYKNQIEQADDVIVRRVIFQKEALEAQIQDLLKKKMELTEITNQQNQLLELTKRNLSGMGLDQSLAQQFGTLNSQNIKYSDEIRQLKLQKEELEQRVKSLENQCESQKRSWQLEKKELKDGWEQIYNEICNQLGVTV